jgi:hypothetical protein
MNTTFGKTRLGICLVLAISCVTSGSAVSSDRPLLPADDPAKSESIHDATRRAAMITALASSNPNPSLGDEAQTFDRLVGTWDAEFTFHREDGTVVQKKGELRFGWTMDGHAIQDLWIGYPTENQKQRSIGTTIRFFDTTLKQWRVVFINPQFNYVVSAQGGREGDRIVLRGVDTDRLPIRWTFSEMKPNSFHWQGEKSHDGGKTWKLEEDHHMKRRL